MCELCELCEQLTKMPTWDNCKYATTTIFFVLNCIFFGFRAFYLFFIQIFAVILHRNSKSPHAHRTLIALPSHTRTRATAMRRSSSASRVPVAYGCSKRFQDPLVPLMRWKMVARTKNNFGNLEKFCLLKYKSKQVYLVLFILFTPARFIPNPLVPAPRSYLSGGHGGNWLWV